ncbi:hypothetical protein K5I29_05375 [Flavobacterium agricola]|uniref:MFS transporter n=1 Tax=Flavobacterium agricola TaxID=2870839 RepID=A0ABY6M1A4_9FLAO|nr:hypothetical protein [Flavobacterium agricola]UYW02330.1 hypothetical protein K5I29_05375 [Flavobacterium agricola]
MDAPMGPFRIPAINNYIPEKIKPWLFVLFVVLVQFSGGGVYLATLNEMVSGRALLTEDVQMAGFASMVGMVLVFTFMLRLKMRFTSKTSMLVCCGGLVICNIICLYTVNLFVLVSVCFVAGMLKMWATFECNSSIQLWITPTRDMPIFFSYIYLLVQGVIIMGGATQIYVSLFTNFQYVNYVVIGVLLLMMLAVLLLFNNGMYMPFVPLFGIDWFGAFMWGLIMLCINFIFIYGNHLDWYDSSSIQMATVFLVVLLALNIYRASFIRHPFIDLKTFTYKPVWQSVLLYFIIDILIAPTHLVEHIYFEAVLGYDTHNINDINLISWIGVVAGAFFTWRFFAVAKQSFKKTFMIGIGAIVLYEIGMYFIIDANTSKYMLAVPLFLRNFGYVTLAIVLISDLMRVPFQHFFQAISIQAFMSAACGSAIGGALTYHLFQVTTTKNFQLLSASLDKVNASLFSAQPQVLQGLLSKQILLTSFKEMYGYFAIAGILLLIILLLYRYPYLPKNLIYPRNKTIKKKLRKN